MNFPIPAQNKEAAPVQEAALIESICLHRQTTATREVNPRPVVRTWTPPPELTVQEEAVVQPVEPFPIDVFPEPLKAVAKELAEVYQVPVSLSAMSGLAVMSGAVGQAVIVKGARRDLKTKLNLYVIPVAERGSGKGIVGEKLTKPIITRSHELADAYHRKVSGFQAEVGTLLSEIKALQSDAAKATGVERERTMADLAAKTERKYQLEKDGKRNVTLWCGDATSEALTRNLADNGETLFSYSSEAGAAVKVAFGKYTANGKSDFDLLLSAYSGDSVRVDRVSRASLELTEPRLALLWMVQPCVIEEIVGDPEAVARGLTARPLIFDSGARREHDDRQERSFTRHDQWETFIRRILATREATPLGSPVEIQCDREAREVFAQLNDETVDLERGPYSDLPGELSRWRENAIKVAGLFAEAEKLPKVTLDHARRAVAVVRWCGLNYLGLRKTRRREQSRSDVRRLLEIVLISPGEEISVGTIESGHGFTRERLNMLVKLFPDLLELHTHPPAGPGRPRTVLRRPINPVNPVN